MPANRLTTSYPTEEQRSTVKNKKSTESHADTDIDQNKRISVRKEERQNAGRKQERIVDFDNTQVIDKYRT